MWILEHILVPTMGTFLKCYSFPITPSSQFDNFVQPNLRSSGTTAAFVAPSVRPSVETAVFTTRITIRSNAKTEEEGSA